MPNSILAFLVTIAVLIVVHEWGHYRVARACGIKVLKFSIGFGKPLYSWRLKNNSTEFVIGMLPLGTFWGKYYLLQGSVAGGKWPLAVVLVVSGFLNAVCFIPVVVKAFRAERTPSPAPEEGGVRVALMLAPTLLLVVIGLGMGLFPGLVWPGVQAVVDWFF